MRLYVNSHEIVVVNSQEIVC